MRRGVIWLGSVVLSLGVVACADDSSGDGANDDALTGTGTNGTDGQSATGEPSGATPTGTAGANGSGSSGIHDDTGGSSSAAGSDTSTGGSTNGGPSDADPTATGSGATPSADADDSAATDDSSAVTDDAPSDDDDSSGSGGETGVDGAGGMGGDSTDPDAAGGAAGGTQDTDPPRDTGANYPFPQNQASDYCVYASNYDNADVRAAYDLWKETVVTSEGAGEFLRVRKPDSGTVIDSTVSEGIGYGMLLAVYMDDQEVFDGLWEYAMAYFNDNGLMNWEVDPNGVVIGTGAALDGDEDMGWALVMADRQWGGSGSLDDTYLNHAVALINAMWDHEIDHSRGEMPLPGDSWGGDDITNISYFAPAYYRVFGQVTNNEAGWNAAIDRSYEVLNASLRAEYGNVDNGLVPAWCDSSGVPKEAYAGAPLHFQNDSTRTPFRFGQDYCYYGEPRARSYMEKITSFYTSVGVSNIVDGYELDGTPRPDFSQNGGQPASFVGPAAVGAMYSADNQAFIDEAYAAVATGELTAGTIYYQKSWTALSLLMLTGNFVEFPAR